jgi:hypothetical protein
MQRKSVQVFLLHAAFFLALLSTASSGSREVYARAFHSAGNFALASLGDGRSVRFQWADPAARKDSADTRMLGRHLGEIKYRWRVIYSSHRRMFWPSATLLALTLATPMSRRRRLVVVPVGFILFNAFFLLEVAGLSLALYGAVGAADETSWVRHSGLPVAQALFNSPITNFSMIFFLWAWLAQPTRGIDLASVNLVIRRLLGSSEAAPAKPPPVDGDAS